MSNLHENRPLSPHLGIYRWQITNTLSILHRITGFGLTLGLIPFTLWLWGAAYDKDLYEALSVAAATIFGKVCMVAWMLAFYYHLANGIRHLNWDLGKGFALDEALASGRIAVVFAIAMTIFTCAIIAQNITVV